MKKLFLTGALIAIAVNLLCQAPQGFNYQAILRNSDGTIKANETVTLQISIVDEMGAPSYTEVHNAETNEFGLVNLVIGQGATSGDFTMLNWSASPYFIDITVDGTNLGSSPLLSVPYALYAESGNEGPIGPPGMQGLQGEMGPTGPKGDTGDPGPQGIPGVKGEQGDTGSPGLKGDTGEQGLKGDQGDIGLQGEQGLQGPQGDQGEVGPVGPQGEIGKTGPEGEQGPKGDQGEIGPQGPPGEMLDHYIGEYYGGGIVFWVSSDKQHGLIAATSDQGTNIVWTNPDFQGTNSNARRDGIKGGMANTERIINQAGAGSYAAQLCANYKGGNYADWYLPSKYELNLMYMNIGQGNALGLGNVGGFGTNYWSSTENNAIAAMEQNFNSGYYETARKNYTDNVRAIRAF